MPRTKVITMLSLATTLFAPAVFAQNTISARPGTINYIEGQATLNGQTLTASSVGHTEIGQGQTIATTDGKVEILLTPGVFLRLGSDSCVTMISPDLTKTEVQLDRGRAELEVDQLYKQNNLLVDQGPAQAKLLDHGLYEFDAASGTVRVFDGKLAVSPAQEAQKWITVKGGHELPLNGQAEKPANFDRDQMAREDALYKWSSLRAEYLGKANLKLAEEYAGAPGLNPGWRWDSALYSYTWLPSNGLFFSPFGYGFHSPYYLYGGGPIYPGYGSGGFYGGGYGFGGGGIYRGGYVHSGPGLGGRGISAGVANGGFHGGGGRR